MKRRLCSVWPVLVLALLAVVLSVSACGSQEKTTLGGASGLGDNPQTFTSSANGFTFQYPDGWKIDESATTDATAGSSATSSAAAFDPKGAEADGTFIDLMQVAVYSLDLTITDDILPELETEIQNLLSSIEAQSADAQVASPLATIEAAGLKGYKVTYTFTKGGVPTTSSLYFLFKDNMEYLVTLQAANEHWAGLQDTFGAMLESFKAQ